MDLKFPLISIALSSYNGEKYIKEQLNSLIKQTYAPLEIIIVDDCSNDSTLSILKEYEKKYDNIKVFSNEHNLGFNKSFEKAFSLCSGEYIAISDQDDYWMENKVSKLYQHIGEALLIYSNSLLIDENGNILKEEKGGEIQPAINDPRSFSIQNVVSGHTILFRKDLLKYILPLPKVGYYDWWMALIAANENKIASLNECLTKHRIHTSNASRKQNFSIDKKYASMHAWVNCILEIKNIRYREFFEELSNILGMKNTKLRNRYLKYFQFKNNRFIYNKKGLISRLDRARKIRLIVMPGFIMPSEK